ncbi:ChaN family lipoprotein [Undibacterium sp. Ji22W]|uniref:ChaN family lipoprotein n=1 Tax=Undibacterium sp. Ji22W TaxID=3413038 RepID=UPI003BF1F026
MRAIFSLMFCFAFLPFAAQAQNLSPVQHPLSGKIVNAQAAYVTEQRAFDLVRQYRYVFVGEKHDNPTHHQLEQRLIQERFKAPTQVPQGRVVFEMLDSSHEAAIAQLQPTDTLEHMKSTLNWPTKGGWDWAAYSPSFQEALKNSALAAGNIDRQFITSVYKNGEKNFVDVPRFSTAINPPEALKNYLLDQIFASHCGMQSRETLMPMLHIQLAKDASMASAMAATPAAMLIAGGEHVRAETGAPWHLRKKQPSAEVMVLQIVEVQAGNVDVASYIKKAGVADLYWFTEATEAKDYCAGVKGKAAQ